MTEPALKEIALAELARRHALAREAVAARRATAAQLETRLRTWAAIAAFFHADVRPLLTHEPGVYRTPLIPSDVEGPHWIDFCPAREPADAALRRIAEECRRATEEARRRHAATPAEPALRDRCANLQRLDDRLSVLAKLPPIQPPAAQQVAA